MGLAHQKFLERVTAAGLVVSVVVTSFNPRDHPGRRELGLLHFADVEAEAGERWAGPRWEVAGPPVPLTVILSTGVGVTTCLPHCLRAGGPRTRPRGWNDSGPRTPAASLELPRRLGLHSSPPPPLTSLSHSPPIVCIPRSPGVRLQPCLSVCPCLSVHVSVTCVWCTVGLVGVSVSVSLCVPLLVMYLSVSVSLHPPLSVHFYLYLALSYLSIQKCLSLVSFLLIRVSPGLSMSLYVSPGQSLPSLCPSPSVEYRSTRFIMPRFFSEHLPLKLQQVGCGLRWPLELHRPPGLLGTQPEGATTPTPYLCSPQSALPTSLSAPAAPRLWGPDEQMLYYLEGEPGRGSCTPIYLLWPSSGPIFPCQLSFARASHMSVSNFQRARADAQCRAGMTLSRPHPQACLPVPAPLFP